MQCHGSELPAQLDTTKYANGQHALLYGAGNAAGVISAPSKTISVDNAPVTLSLTGPTDALSTAGTQYVDANATAGPSGVGAILCSVDGSPYQSYSGSAAQVPVSGVGPHRVDCYAQNGAVDASGGTGHIADADVEPDDPRADGVRHLVQQGRRRVALPQGRTSA